MHSESDLVDFLLLEIEYARSLYASLICVSQHL